MNRTLPEAEAALHGSEAKYRLLFENIPLPVIMYDLETLVILDVNTAAVKRYGYSHAEFCALTIKDLRPPEKRPALLPPPLHVPSEVDYIRKHQQKDGTLIDVEITSHVIRYAGRPTQISVIKDITEQKRAEAALQESEERLQLALQAGAMGTWEMDLTSGINTISRAHEIQLGCRPGTYQGTLDAFLECVHPTDREALVQVIVRAIEERASVTIEFRVVWPDGSIHWLAAKGRCFCDETGKPIRLCGASMDITERKQAEQALYSQTCILQSVLDSMGDGVAVVDNQGKFLLFNPAAERILQSGPTDTGPEGWTSAYGLFLPDKKTPYPPTEFPLTRAMWGDAVDQAEVLVHNPYLLDEVWLSLTARPLVNENNALQGAVAVFRDITQAKQAEEALHQYAERLEILRRIDQAILSAQSLETIAEAAVRHILQLLPCRQASVVLFDFDRQECLPVATAPTSDALHWSVGKCFPIENFGREAMEALQQGKVCQFETNPSPASPLPTVHALRTPGLCSYLEVPLMYQGRTMGSLCLGAALPGVFTQEHTATARAVADQLAIALRQARLHEQIQQANTELERRVAERTRQLQEAVQELEAFSYSVSHDLRAPLRAIDNFSRILQDQYALQLPAGAQACLGHVRENTQQMGRLIGDLLAFSRLGRQAMNMQSVSPAALAREVLSDLSAEQEGRSVEIVLGDLPDCPADRTLLKQVFVNLLSNALKYTRTRETAQIEIGCLPSVDTNDPPVYFVRDNGVGFDMRYAHKLFGVFQRLHRTEDFEGTGVGLAIVERILRRHGGRIWAEAEIDQGAVFYFTVEGEPEV